jgi:hypothetical protein
MRHWLTPQQARPIGTGTVAPTRRRSPRWKARGNARDRPRPPIRGGSTGAAGWLIFVRFWRYPSVRRPNSLVAGGMHSTRRSAPTGFTFQDGRRTGRTFAAETRSSHSSISASNSSGRRAGGCGRPRRVPRNRSRLVREQRELVEVANAVVLSTGKDQGRPFERLTTLGVLGELPALPDAGHSIGVVRSRPIRISSRNGAGFPESARPIRPRTPRQAGRPASRAVQDQDAVATHRAARHRHISSRWARPVVDAVRPPIGHLLKPRRNTSARVGQPRAAMKRRRVIDSSMEDCPPAGCVRRSTTIPTRSPCVHRRPLPWRR